jgi:hypothetical protein
MLAVVLECDACKVEERNDSCGSKVECDQDSSHGLEGRFGSIIEVAGDAPLFDRVQQSLSCLHNA